MNSNLELISTLTMSRADWLRFRKDGVGASEFGAILGASPYKSSLELYYEKIGERYDFDIPNIFKFMGIQHEPLIADIWQYWDGDEASIITNFAKGKEEGIVRRCRKINAYVRNPKYPWMFVSLDRIINKTSTRGEGALEIKTISGYESDKWETGIPLSHIFQVIGQVGVCEFEFGELATLKDGRRFDVYPFEANPEIFNNIVEKTKIFWDKCVAGKKLMTQRYEYERAFDIKGAQQITAEIEKLEPEPDGSDAYNDFLKKKFNLADAGLMNGTDEHYAHALKHIQGKEEVKEIEERIQFHENSLKRILGDKDHLEFGDRGKVTWKINKKGSRVFLNKIKQ